MDELKDAIVQLIGRYQHNASQMDTDEGLIPAAILRGVVRDLREAIGMEDHQHVVWMAGATPPHYEIVGTGLVFDGPRRPVIDRRGHCPDCPPCRESHDGHCPRHAP